MRDIPVLLSGYKARISESPVLKMRKNDKTGEQVPATDRDGVNQFLVVLFVKPKAGGKGEEIKVTLATDPGDGFEDGTVVELIDPTISAYSFENDEGKTISGISFKAAGLKPLG